MTNFNTPPCYTIRDGMVLFVVDFKSNVSYTAFTRARLWATARYGAPTRGPRTVHTRDVLTVLRKKILCNCNYDNLWPTHVMACAIEKRRVFATFLCRESERRLRITKRRGRKQQRDFNCRIRAICRQQSANKMAMVLVLFAMLLHSARASPERKCWTLPRCVLVHKR